MKDDADEDIAKYDGEFSVYLSFYASNNSSVSYISFLLPA